MFLVFRGVNLGWPFFYLIQNAYYKCYNQIKNMIILRETDLEQELNIIARDSDIDLLTFTDEQTGDIFTVEDVVFLDAGYYLTTDVALDFLEQDHTYRMRAYLGSDISFNSLVFVTNQDVLDNVGVYNANEGQYAARTEESNESKYITYED